MSELQELAIAMNRPNNVDDVKGTNTTLKEVDELAKQYDSSTILVEAENPEIDEQKKKKCCSTCIIY